jgi:hypothetical protein
MEETRMAKRDGVDLDELMSGEPDSGWWVGLVLFLTFSLYFSRIQTEVSSLTFNWWFFEDGSLVQTHLLPLFPRLEKENPWPARWGLPHQHPRSLAGLAIRQAGRGGPVLDFYGHPGILDDTKSVYHTHNVWCNYRTLSQKVSIPSIEILYVKGRNFLSHEETSCHRKKLPVTRRNFQSREENSCHSKKPPVTVRNLLSQ